MCRVSRPSRTWSQSGCRSRFSISLSKWSASPAATFPSRRLQGALLEQLDDLLPTRREVIVVARRQGKYVPRVASDLTRADWSGTEEAIIRVLPLFSFENHDRDVFMRIVLCPFWIANDQQRPFDRFAIRVVPQIAMPFFPNQGVSLPTGRKHKTESILCITVEDGCFWFGRDGLLMRRSLRLGLTHW